MASTSTSPPWRYVTDTCHIELKDLPDDVIRLIISNTTCARSFASTCHHYRQLVLADIRHVTIRHLPFSSLIPHLPYMQALASVSVNTELDAAGIHDLITVLTARPTLQHINFQGIRIPTVGMRRGLHPREYLVGVRTAKPSQNGGKESVALNNYGNQDRINLQIVSAFRFRSLLDAVLHQKASLRHHFRSRSDMYDPYITELVLAIPTYRLATVRRVELDLGMFASPYACMLVAAVRAMPTLEELTLGVTLSREKAAIALLNTVPMITKLTLQLSHTATRTSRLQSRELLSNLSYSLLRLTALQCLDISNLYISHPGASSLGHSLRELPSLQHLRLSGSQCHDGSDVIFLSALSDVCSLSSLELSDYGFPYLENPFSLSGGRLTGLPMITRLNVSYSTGNVGVFPVSCIHSLFRLVTLEHLNLAGIMFDGGKQIVLATALARLTRLSHLDLSRTNYEVGGVSTVIHSLRALTLLKHLDLSEIAFGGCGTRDVAVTVLGLRCLRHLDLCGLWFDDDEASMLGEALGHLTALKKLGLSKCLLSPQGLRVVSMNVPEVDDWWSAPVVTDDPPLRNLFFDNKYTSP